MSLRRVLLVGVAWGLAVGFCAPARAQEASSTTEAPEAEAGVTPYPASFFIQYQPATAMDMLRPPILQRMIVGMGQMPEEVLRSDGMFGPRIDVPEDADDQTKFLGYVGRRA